MADYDQDVLDALEEEFVDIAFDLFRKRRRSESHRVCDVRIRAWCGCSALVIAKIWYLLNEDGSLPEHATKEKLLWALQLLKCYTEDRTGAAFCGGVDEGTYRRWTWFFIDEMSFLENRVVSVVNYLVSVLLCSFLSLCMFFFRFCGKIDTKMMSATPVLLLWTVLILELREQSCSLVNLTGVSTRISSRGQGFGIW